MAEVKSLEKFIRNMYTESVNQLHKCQIPSPEFDLAMAIIQEYRIYCVSKNNKDNLEKKDDSE